MNFANLVGFVASDEIVNSFEYPFIVFSKFVAIITVNKWAKKINTKNKHIQTMFSTKMSRTTLSLIVWNFPQMYKYLRILICYRTSGYVYSKNVSEMDVGFLRTLTKNNKNKIIMCLKRNCVAFFFNFNLINLC